MFRAGSIARTRPRKVTDKAGIAVSSLTKMSKTKLTLAESVIHFCKTNKNCSGLQIIFFVASQQAKILEQVSKTTAQSKNVIR